MHAAVAAALYRERPQQLSRAEQEWDVSQARLLAEAGSGVYYRVWALAHRLSGGLGDHH